MKLSQKLVESLSLSLSKKTQKRNILHIFILMSCLFLFHNENFVEHDVLSRELPSINVDASGNATSSISIVVPSGSGGITKMPGEILKDLLFDKLPAALDLKRFAAINKFCTLMMGEGNLLFHAVGNGEYSMSLFDGAMLMKDIEEAKEDGFSTGELIDLAIKSFGLVTNGAWGNTSEIAEKATKYHRLFEVNYENYGDAIGKVEEVHKYYQSFYPDHAHKWTTTH